MAAAEEEKTVAAVEVKVGVVLNPNAFGKMGMACISMALSDFYASRSHYKTKVILKTVDSNGTVVDAAAAGSFFTYE